jgi:hypothetical protein
MSSAAQDCADFYSSATTGIYNGGACHVGLSRRESYNQGHDALLLVSKGAPTWLIPLPLTKTRLGSGPTP